MDENLSPSTQTARSAINARRRRIGLVQVCLLAPMCGSVWWLATHGVQGFTVVLPIVVFGFISAVLGRLETCPVCRNCTGMLPSEGHFRIPELSRRIRVCPYCGTDLSDERSVKANKPE